MTQTWEKEFIFYAMVLLFIVIALSFSTTSKKRLTVFSQNVKITIDNENITNNCVLKLKNLQLYY